MSELYIDHCNIQYGLDSIDVDTLAMVYWGDNNIDEDPLFSDPMNGDYHLTEESPCIDMGIDSINVIGEWLHALANDIEGNPRTNVFSNTPDIGAYEYQPITSVKDGSVSEICHAIVYPNPFNHILNFELNLKQASRISIEIYNLLGTKIAHVIDGKLEADRHQLTWSARGIDSGIYICRIQIENELISEKILLSR